MKTYLSVAVLSTALIGGVAATSTPANAYAGWSCKPRYTAAAGGPSAPQLGSSHDDQALLAEARNRWVNYVQVNHGSAYLSPRGVQSKCQGSTGSLGGWSYFCSYAADPCKNTPPASETNTKAGGKNVSSLPPGGKVASRPDRITGAPVGQGRVPSLRPRQPVAVK